MIGYSELATAPFDFSIVVDVVADGDAKSLGAEASAECETAQNADKAVPDPVRPP